MVSEATNPYPMKLGLSSKPALNFGVPLSGSPLSTSPDLIQTQQHRLEQSTSSLVSSLETAEKKMTSEEAAW